MRWMILALIILLSADCMALHVEDEAHTSLHKSVVRVFMPLSTLNAVDLENNVSSDFKLKVYNQIPILRITLKNFNSSSNYIILNVSNRNRTLLIKNKTALYSEFIEKLNMTVIIGKNSLDSRISKEDDIELYKNFLRYKGKMAFRPYNAGVISLTDDGQRKIIIYGNGVEGEIAALRYLKKHADEFIYDNSAFIDGIDALSVYDYLHSPENNKWYNIKTPEFYAIVDKALFGKADERMIDVKTNDVMLRVIELTPRNTEKMNNFRNDINLPVVLARGLWSNLYSWQEYGVELADNGRKVYLIEITGGPEQDCSLCVNYNYSDLTLEYWPALIGTVQTINNGSSIQYVGHSNGARVGISSLELYNEVGKANSGFYLDNNTWVNVSMSAHPIDTYIAVGMPGAFDGSSALSGLIEWRGNIIQEKIKDNELTHVTISNIQTFGLTNLNYMGKNGSDTISVNLWNNYYYWILYENDSQPGINLSLDNFMVIQGTGFMNNDGIVTTKDEESLYTNINSTNKYYFTYFSTHIGLPDRNDVRKVMNELLNSKRINSSKSINYKNGTNK